MTTSEGILLYLLVGFVFDWIGRCPLDWNKNSSMSWQFQLFCVLAWPFTMLVALLTRQR